MDAKTWNEKYRVGVVVQYHPINRRHGELTGMPFITHTTSEAYEMQGRSVVEIKRLSGYLDLSNQAVDLECLVVLDDLVQSMKNINVEPR